MNSPLFCSHSKNIGHKVSRKNIRRLLQLCGERMKEGGEKEEAIMQISQFFFLAAPQDPILSSHYTHRDQSIFMGPTPRLSRIEKKAKIIKSFLLVPNKIWKLQGGAGKEEPISELSLFPPPSKMRRITQETKKGPIFLKNILSLLSLRANSGATGT